jgi:uncharacterized membrane protein
VVEAEFVVFGIRYRIPVVRRPTSTIGAVNSADAVIPGAVSLYPLVAGGIWWPALAATAIVTAVVQRAACRASASRSLRSLPAVLGAASAVQRAPSRTAAVAYVARTLGTLIGADLLN